MSGPGRPPTGPLPIYLTKGLRVYASGLMSIVIPFYLRTLGYSLFFQGVALVAILAGGAFSNVAVVYLDSALGRRRLLQAFSGLMLASGATLALSTNAAVILAACFLGNISSTGTEAGPFQSIEAGVLPDLAPGRAAVNAFGRYNLIGYSAAALGQLTSAGPGMLGNAPAAFQAVFIGFALVGVLLLAIYTGVNGLERGRSTHPGLEHLGVQARKDVVRLSGLFSLDAFGGVFVSTYLLSIWFSVTFGLALTALGPLFFVASVLAAASTYGAALIARRIGNLRTMVYTHLTSAVFLFLMAVAGSLGLALLFLLLRQSFSQMDVPTRQALMSEMFTREERVQAYAVTNTMRTGGSLAGGPVSATILGLGLVSGLLFAGFGTKVVYDLLTFASFRKRYR